MRTTRNFARCIARFRGPGGLPCGTGFLIDRWHVMTCAHVVNAAQGQDSMTTAELDRAVAVELPFLGYQERAARIVEWHPPVPYADLNAARPSDVAVLRLGVEQPVDAVARPAVEQPDWGTDFFTFGFPVEHGKPADAEVLYTDTGGWIHFRPTAAYGHVIEQGFSGAPAFTKDDGRLIGMVVAVQTGDGSRVSYGEPLRRLQMAWPPVARPYKGLARFDPADTELFFGREADTADLMRRVEVDPLTLVVGPSGGGKSSLVFGGLLPRLGAYWRGAHFRPGAEPVRNLCSALAELMTGNGDAPTLMTQTGELRRRVVERPTSVLDAAQAVRRQKSDRRLLLVADQLEELFTLCRDPDERDLFVQLVEVIAGQRGVPVVTLVATLRADFMGEILRSPLSQALEGRYLMLRAMNGAELGRAIRRPAEGFGVRFEAGVDDDILATVARDADALPLMEFALERLWDEQQKRTLTRAAYDRMGGLEGALAQHADEFIDGLDQMTRDEARKLLCRLVNVVRPGEGEDTKRPQSRQELGETLWAIAQRMAGEHETQLGRPPARLVVLYRDEQGREVADIIHEALIRHWPRLKEWLAMERSFRLFADDLQRARRRWEDGRLPDRLLRGRDLDEALGHQERLTAEYPELLELVAVSGYAKQGETANAEANDIWEPLEFTDGELADRELAALWRLATADERVRRAFLRHLYEFPDRARRFCRLPGPVVRAVVGLRRDRKELLHQTLRESFAGGRRPEVVAAALFLLALTGEDDQSADAALAEALSSTAHGDEIFAALAAWALELAPRLDAERAGRALDRVLEGIGGTTHPDQLRAFGQAATASQLSRAERTISAVLNAVKFPNTALEAVDKALLEALQPYAPDLPPPDEGFWKAIKWWCGQCPDFDFDAPPRCGPGRGLSGDDTIPDGH